MAYNRIPQRERAVGQRGKYGLTISLDKLWAEMNGVVPGTKLKCYPHPRKKNVMCMEAPKQKK